ncbi:ABC transporter permease [Diaphorobacter sp. C33]|uniref:Phospholipid/cholesterol/gamma-HCH transport system permease protein n=2 Tax=Diaphorobacter TaxID=238749 RepID=A0AAX1WRQ5_9BURK|nr:ABC transporter permease [Diaphorobacter sp. C33]ROR40473.1 phospholipid/cholesterol/gamma-HCH transport system permease protein [Diaphorobacter nitroreducens]WKK90031.1 ABC transporter permease [Diaphorobacter sp. C33]
MNASLHPFIVPRRLWAQARRWAVAWWRIIYLGAVVMVLMLSPSSYGRATRWRLARHMYQDTAPILLGFTVLAALISLVITRIVVVTALSYGLSRYALEMVIRVLVLELIPLTAALFVAMRATIPNGTQLALMRQSGHLQALRQRGADPVRMELLPRVVAGVYASITLAALSCVVALVMAYLGVYGLNTAGLPVYTRMFGHVFAPQITLVFVLKTVFFSLAVALIPMASGLYESGDARQAQQPDSELGGLARMFAVLLLIEVISLMGNYY